MNLCDKEDIFQVSERFIMITFTCVEMYVISTLGSLHLNNRVLGYLLVPELIIEGWEGLKLPSSEELVICTVNVTNSAQILVPATSSLSVHGQGNSKANEPCFTRLQSVFVELSFKVVITQRAKLLNADWSMKRVRSPLLGAFISHTSQPFLMKSYL